jgi:hypothetical protein
VSFATFAPGEVPTSRCFSAAIGIRGLLATDARFVTTAWPYDTDEEIGLRFGIDACCALDCIDNDPGPVVVRVDRIDGFDFSAHPAHLGRKLAGVASFAIIIDATVAAYVANSLSYHSSNDREEAAQSVSSTGFGGASAYSLRGISKREPRHLLGGRADNFRVYGDLGLTLSPQY